MCGITGILNLNKKPVDKTVLTKMTKTLSHRGPDDEGIFVDKNIGLGHRRLSIIDLSSAGHQPMFYDNKNLIIVYNGEVYNYLEIKEELVNKGYKFVTKTDTEVILASYKEWGTDCLKRFNGMWAFIIYDQKNDLIFAARDRLGVKPLYYLADKEKILLASEIKAILQYPGVKAEPKEKIIWDYLVAGWVDHSAETFFENVKELRGGHYLILRKKKIEIKKYWDLTLEENKLSETENIKKFKDLFIDAVKLRLRSDVALGTCLSGGLDSSAIVMAVNQSVKQTKLDQVGRWQKTFSAIYDKKNQNCDESQHIKVVLNKTGAKPYFVTPKGEKLKSEIEKIVWHQDQPFLSTSIYAQWNVFRLASQKKVKVMLDGQGADELLAGYTGYFGLYFQSLLKTNQFTLLLSELNYFAKKHPPFWKALGEIFTRALRAGWLGNSSTRFFQNINPAYQIFSESFLKQFSVPKRISFSKDSFTNALYNSLKMNLSSLLRYEDRDSMAFSIESRVPFLDYRLVEFIFSLPANYKIRQGETKWVMRKALKGLLPEKIRNRQDKIGFATPEQDWLQKDMKKELITCFSSESFAKRGYWDSSKVLELYQKFLKGEFKDSQLFWRLYNLEIWFRVFID